MAEIGFAFTDPGGEVVHALTAPRGERYRCPQCLEPVVLKRGEVRRAHFAHSADSLCAGESVEHRAAKRLAAQRLREQLEQRGSLAWLVACAGADAPCPTDARLERMLALLSWADVREEVTVGAYRADVAVLGASGEPLFALEVFHMHRVDAEKATGLRLPWIEVTSAALLERKALLALHGSGSKLRCAACERTARTQAQRHARELERESELEAFKRELRDHRAVWNGVLGRARGMAFEARAARAAAVQQRPASPAPLASRAQTSRAQTALVSDERRVALERFAHSAMPEALVYHVRDERGDVSVRIEHGLPLRVTNGVRSSIHPNAWRLRLLREIWALQDAGSPALQLGAAGTRLLELASDSGHSRRELEMLIPM